jgi:hypothetical protein
VSSTREILFLITLETIDQMMEISRVKSASPFNLEIITELYQKLLFPQRAQIFEIFIPQSAQLPTTNPPYPSSLFSMKGNQVITSLWALFGYFSDHWVDEPILGFLSIFSTDEKPTAQMTTPQIPKEKRPRMDTSPSVTEVSSKEFRLHTKKLKTTQAPDTAGEKEIPSTTMSEVDWSLLSTRNK